MLDLFYINFKLKYTTNLTLSYAFTFRVVLASNACAICDI